jgi:RNA polymerase sigma factor (sigma-70 family)
MASSPPTSVLHHLRKMIHTEQFEEASDAELLRRFRAQRDEEAFVALLKRHGQMVLRVCRRIGAREQDAEDVFQATFLVLARKADAIRNPTSVASWLHGVAHRLALEAKRQGARRRARERRAATITKVAPGTRVAWEDLQALLDEALRQVPQRYRAPLLLCYLEGKTQEEAARQLGCPLGTVRSRIARGRERLKAVLERRGLRLSATALAAALAASDASAAVPPPLLHATARAALAYAAGMAPAKLVSAPVAALLQRGLQAIAMAKFKIVASALVLVCTLGLGAAVVATRFFAGFPVAAAELEELSAPDADGQPSVQKAADDKAPARADEQKAETHLRGRVLDSEGKPVAGAKLQLLGGSTPVDLGTTAMDGRFAVTIPRDRPNQFLVARAENAGIDFVHIVPFKPNAPIELRMVKDVPIHGRVFDTQGQPVPDVRVSARSLGVYASNSADPLLTAYKNLHPMDARLAVVKELWSEPGSMFATTTDAEGRFVIRGAGTERLVWLRFCGAGIAEEEAWVVTRAGFDPKAYNEASLNNMPKDMELSEPRRLLYGPDLSVVTQAEKLIRGVVKDADSGKGLAGVEVGLIKEGAMHFRVATKAKTDAQGRYEFHGARKSVSYTLQVDSQPDTGFLSRQLTVADSAGYEPTTADIQLAKGVVITGRSLDASTGKPVPGLVMLGILAGNSFMTSRPEFDGADEFRWVETAADGTFRVVGIPGAVLLMAAPNEHRLPDRDTVRIRYKPVAPDPSHPQYFPDQMRFNAYNGVKGLMHIQGNFCKVLDIEPGRTLVKQDVLFQPLATLPIQIKGADGKSSGEVWVTGMSSEVHHRALLREAQTCLAYGLEAGKSRLMVFFEPKRRLAGILRLNGDEKQPPVVDLSPTGSVEGRLTAEDGKPITGLVVEVHYTDRPAEEIHSRVHVAQPQVLTNANGAFHIDELIPGVAFNLHYHRTRRDAYRGSTVLEKAIQVKPAETLDVGTIKLKAGEVGGDKP